VSTNIDALAIRRRLGTGWRRPEQFGIDGWLFDHVGGARRVIVTCAPHDDGHEWVHASISAAAMPTYDDLVMMHAAVFGDAWAYQVFAPAAEHVNIHERALHLFGRLDGAPVLPDFTMGTGSI
jgi:hypothetical protein